MPAIVQEFILSFSVNRNLSPFSFPTHLPESDMEKTALSKQKHCLHRQTAKQVTPTLNIVKQ